MHRTRSRPNDVILAAAPREARPPSRAPRGLTLVETMVAMSIMLIGAMGMVATSKQGLRMNGDGRRMTRAVTIAQDLASQVELWEYADPRLANTSASNDPDYGDAAFAFEAATGTPAADHGEADLTAGGTEFEGLPAASLQAGQYERYWNVAEVDDANGNGNPDGKRIAVIVRWPQGAGFRRIVLHLAKSNPDPTERL